ncbi:hypothetical protein [Bradyrhizobium genosp. P]|uniref:hypothetical protein n=1 Tax=Bradyrhizobium genosp. P TaxID=83641 RepID=UPI003CE91E63
MAAAAIASGAAGWSDGAGVTGALVGAGAAAITVATAVAALAAFCCASVWLVVGCVSVDWLFVDWLSLVDLESSDFDVDFDLVLDEPLLLPSTLLSPREELVSRDDRSVVVEEESSVRRGGGVFDEADGELSVLAAVLVSNSAAKPSLRGCDVGSDRADRRAAA